mmetsp:Transcript_10434/g.14646  ORF Transcript_10434/g.14646 Transcript_10434/m.14646 type:complete len:288 (+) Transcript_10434:353-1216(+)
MAVHEGRDINRFYLYVARQVVSFLRIKSTIIMEGEIKDHDVLFGRGNGVANHCGNRRFRDLIKAYRPLYLDAPRHSRSLIATNVVAAIQSSDPPGRFLEDIGEGRYRIASHSKALEKAMQALRKSSCDMRSAASSAATSSALSSSTTSDKTLSLDDPVQNTVELLATASDDVGRSSCSFASKPKRILEKNQSRYFTFNNTTIDHNFRDTSIQNRWQNPPLSSKLHNVYKAHSTVADASGEMVNTSQAIYNYCVRNGYTHYLLEGSILQNVKWLSKFSSQQALKIFCA